MTMQLGYFLTLATDSGDALLPADPATARDGAEFDGLIGALLLASGNVPPDPAQAQRVVGNDLPLDGSRLPAAENPAPLRAPESPAMLPAALPAETALLSSRLPTAATPAPAVPAQAFAVPAAVEASAASSAATQAPAIPAALPPALTERTSQQAADNVPVLRPDSGPLPPGALQRGSQATDVRDSVLARSAATEHGFHERHRPAVRMIAPAVVSDLAMTPARPVRDAPAELLTTGLKKAMDAVQGARANTPADRAARQAQLMANQTDNASLKPLPPQAAVPGSGSVPLPIPVLVPGSPPDTKPAKYEPPPLPDIVKRVRAEQPGLLQPESTRVSRIDAARHDASLPAAVIDIGTPKITLEPPLERLVATPNITAAQGISVPPQSISVAAAGSANTAVVSIDMPVDNPDWADAVSNRVTMLLGRNIGSAELRLSPADLGPVQVQLSVEDGVARVAFSATHPVTREQLESSLPRLREMLEQQGMTLADASVSDQRGREQAASGEFEPESANDMSPADPGPGELGAAMATAAKVTEAGRVDTYV